MFIDSFDIVVRINNIHDINNQTLINDLGKRVDVIYFDGSMNQSRFQDYSKSSPKLLKCTYPESEWFFNDRCKNNISTIKKYFNTEIVDINMYNKLKSSLDTNLKTRPNSGLIAIIDLLSFPLSELYITGIDFYRSSYASYHPDYGTSSLSDIKNIFKNGDNGDVHDINTQFCYFKNIFKNESRIKVDDILNMYLSDIKYENVSF